MRRLNFLGFAFLLLPILIVYFDRPSFNFDIVVPDLDAAAQTPGDGAFKQGYRFYAGIGAPADQDQALYWWRMAAERGDTNALHNLGVMYANGEGVTEDIVQAYIFFELASKLGSRSAYQKARLIPEHMKPDDFNEAQNRIREWLDSRERRIP